jgi:hypothetical protein
MQGEGERKIQVKAGLWGGKGFKERGGPGKGSLGWVGREVEYRSTSGVPLVMCFKLMIMVIICLLVCYLFRAVLVCSCAHHHGSLMSLADAGARCLPYGVF